MVENSDDKKLDIYVKIATIVLILLYITISPLLLYKDWFQWWNKYDPKKKYNCMSIADIAYFQKNLILYKIKTLFDAGNKTFTHDWWIYFMTAFMYGGAVGIVPDGYVTPKSLCESIVPDKYPSNLPGGFGNDWPITIDDWKTLIKLWGNIQIDNVNQKYTSNVKAWQSAPNNFFNTWGIPVDSPIIIGFLTNWTTYNGEAIYADYLHPLLGIQDGLRAGGWMGFLQAGDNFGDRGLVEADRLIWSNDQPPQSIINGRDKNKCNVGDVANNAINMGLAGFMAGGDSPASPFLALGFGLIGALTSAGSHGCF